MTALPADLVATVPTTLDARSVLAPVGALTTTLTTTVERTAPVVPQLLAPVTAVSQTLLGPTGLVDTVSGLTDTTTALIGTVGALGGTTLDPPLEALGGLTVLSGPVGAAGVGAPVVPPTLTPGPGADANRPPGPGPSIGGPPPSAAGPPSVAWSTAGAVGGSVSRPEPPGAPAPWGPAAPAAPVGTAGASAGGGVSGPAGVLPDPLAVPAILVALVLLACGRRGAWWFPEVVVGPD